MLINFPTLRNLVSWKMLYRNDSSQHLMSYLQFTAWWPTEQSSFWLLWMMDREIKVNNCVFNCVRNGYDTIKLKTCVYAVSVVLLKQQNFYILELPKTFMNLEGFRSLFFHCFVVSHSALIIAVFGFSSTSWAVPKLSFDKKMDEWKLATMTARLVMWKKAYS